MVELNINLFNLNCTTKPVPQNKIIFLENLIISGRYYVILGNGGEEGGRTLYSYLQPYIADNLLELLDKKWNPTDR